MKSSQNHVNLQCICNLVHDFSLLYKGVTCILLRHLDSILYLSIEKECLHIPLCALVDLVVLSLV